MYENVYVLFWILCGLCVKISDLTSCSSFDKVKITAHQQDGDPFNKTLTGCIERIAFDDKTVTQAYIRQQKIPKLGRDSVRNMKYLQTISFYGCEMYEVEAGAFRNVPGLRNVQISFCSVKEIPRELFNNIPQLSILRIHNNKIDIIEDQAFANLPELRRIFGSNNRLEYWNREWFTNTTSLEIMDFQFNKIRTLPRRAFFSLQKLKQIYFDFNEISEIHDDAFKGLKYLEYLGLRFNRLKTINGNAFPNVLKIRSFLLDANYLNFLSNELLKQISVKDITLDNNPFKCPCLDRITFWLHQTNATMRVSAGCTSENVPVCLYPTSYSQTCIENVDDEVTASFIKKLQNLESPLDKYCARLD